MSAGAVAVYGHTFPKLDIELAVLGGRNLQLLDGNGLTPEDMAQAGVTGILLGTAKKVDGTLIAAMQFDRSGTTRIGRYLLNHSFMLPGLITTVGGVAIGLLIAKCSFALAN